MISHLQSKSLNSYIISPGQFVLKTVTFIITLHALSLHAVFLLFLIFAEWLGSKRSNGPVSDSERATGKSLPKGTEAGTRQLSSIHGLWPTDQKPYSLNKTNKRQIVESEEVTAHLTYHGFKKY